ncbi:cysteine desulfurase [Allocoprobacillus halotolerans]|uniref:Cysteine desulfurase n=1 Tax=Allocoprobacillus halotolerans TaxID=2944914 RepID=A0ABY5HZI4_9FIRM|nr:cysteine desulfurase family protein [Allocoprobacillus halotolerans]UTY38502.1 cysteine desulfurase [Allocoprobacillus halotolerans]
MIYLDYVSTTPLNQEVNHMYQSLLNDYFANADSLYSLGLKTSALMEKSRELTAQMLKVLPEEIIFTSGASESNSTAIKGCAFQYQNRGKHIITTAVEHSSVYQSCIQLRDVFGFEVDFISVNQNGEFNLKELEEKIRDDTILVTLMYVNNEVGMIFPIQKVYQIIQKKNPKVKLHVDMVQALGKLPIDLSYVDLASFSAHKIYGLKGSGVLYKKASTSLVPLINGGQQEQQLRGGTSNTATHTMFAKTLRLALENLDQNYRYVTSLNQYVRNQLDQIPDIVINTPTQNVSPYILNFSCVGYKPEVILHALEMHECYVSTKSTCASHKNDVSRTLQMMGIDEKIAKSAIRISFSHQTTQEEIDEFLFYLKQVLKTIKKQR